MDKWVDGYISKCPSSMKYGSYHYHLDRGTLYCVAGGRDNQFYVVRITGRTQWDTPPKGYKDLGPFTLDEAKAVYLMQVI